MMQVLGGPAKEKTQDCLPPILNVKAMAEGTCLRAMSAASAFIDRNLLSVFTSKTVTLRRALQRQRSDFGRTSGQTEARVPERFEMLHVRRVSPVRSTTMPLSQSLVSVGLTFECPQCHFGLVKSGSWFRVVSKYECAGCGRQIRITYPDKVALFKKHAHLAASAEPLIRKSGG